MTPETLQLGATFAIAIALIELVKFIVSKYTRNSTGGIAEQMLSEMQKMNDNHLHSIEGAIREQTKVFQEDHVKNLEVLYQIKAGVEQLSKR